MSTHVRPAITSSFSSLSFPTFSRRAFCSTWVRSTRSSSWSKPCWCVPPFGVAMMLTNERVTVSYPVPQRIAMSTWHSRSTSVGTMAPVGWRTGTVSVKVPLPLSRQVSVMAASVARYSANSEMPPSNRNDVSLCCS